MGSGCSGCSKQLHATEYRQQDGVGVGDPALVFLSAFVFASSVSSRPRVCVRVSACVFLHPRLARWLIRARVTPRSAVLVDTVGLHRVRLAHTYRGCYVRRRERHGISAAVSSADRRCVGSPALC